MFPEESLSEEPEDISTEPESEPPVVFTWTDPPNDDCEAPPTNKTVPPFIVCDSPASVTISPPFCICELPAEYNKPPDWPTEMPVRELTCDPVLVMISILPELDCV